ncbi:MAG: alanine racemase [Nitrospirae bacterium]|nr:alanine racemase [Nitrospirota bacterium]
MLNRTAGRKGKKRKRVNRGAVAEIDRSALRYNICSIRERTNHRAIIAVVKADAYGHGSVEVARVLAAQGADYLAVAFVEEARTLREAGIETRILVLFDRSDYPACFDLNLIPVIHDKKDAVAVSNESRKRRKTLPVHIKIDTGMGRMGLRAESAADDVLEISTFEGVMVEGLLSHFSEADLDDKTFALQQLSLFRRLCAKITEQTGLAPVCHMANSAAVFSFPDAMLNAVRPGIALYGYSCDGGEHGLLPVMKITTRVIAVRILPAGSPVSYARTFVTKRTTRIAVVALGYADGFNRLFSNNAEMLVRGQRVPVVGRVCMDLTMLDVTELEHVAEGDEVVVLGAQRGQAIMASELSQRIGTIPYEILTSLGNRSKREYVH